MTTKTYKTLLMGLFVSAAFASCDDYLDNVPKGEKIPTTLEDFSALMGDEYNNSREAVSQAIYLLGDQYVSSSTLSYDRLTRANYLWDTSIDRIKENNSDEMAYYVSYGAISTANLILENIDVLADPDNYQQIQSPMDYWFVENYNFCHGSSIYQSNDAQITVDRAARFEEGDAAFLSRWKLRTIGADTFYEHNLAGLYNRGGMTTTEVWLIEAECLARTGSVSEAMAVLNQVRRSRILPDVYADLEATTEVEAVRQIIETKANALIVTLVPFCDARRLNLDPQYARTLTKVIDGQTLTLAPDSYLWTMAMPQGAQKNSGNGTVTQNVEK